MLHIPDTESISPFEKVVNCGLSETLNKAKNLRTSADDLRKSLVSYLLREDKASQAHSVESCGTFLMFKQYKDPMNTSTLERANFCKHPLCPLCAWRRHLKYNAILERSLPLTRGKLSHLVLAIPNSAQLSRADLMRLKERGKSFIKQKLGCDSYISNLEIVASEKGYHPHLHILLETACYFQVSAQWIKEMSSKWKKHYIKGFKDNTYDNYEGFTFYITGIKSDDVADVCQELTKYIIKGQQKISPEMVEETAEAIYKVRKMSSGGMLRENMQAGKRLTALALDEKLGSLSRHEWEYHIYQFINGNYERKFNTDD